MAGPIDPRTLAIIQAMEPAAAQRQVMQAGLRIAPAPQMGMDEFADVRNPIPQPRGPMTAPQPSADMLVPPDTPNVALQPMRPYMGSNTFNVPIGPKPDRFAGDWRPGIPGFESETRAIEGAIGTPEERLKAEFARRMQGPPKPPAGNMLAPDVEETGSVAPMPAPPPAPAPAGNRLAAEPSPAPMLAPVEPAGNMLAAPTGRRVYDPAAGTNGPRFIYEGGPAPMRAAGGGSAIATGGGAVPAAGGAGGAAIPYSGGDSGGGMGDGFFDFLGGFSRGGLLGGIQGIQLGKQARAKAGLSAQQENMTRQAAKRLGVPDDVANSLDGKSLASLVIDIQKQNMTPKEAKAPDLQEVFTEDGRKQKGYFDANNRWVPVGGAEAASVDASKPTDDMREYELAKQQGYEGTFVDYQRQMREAGRTQVNVDTGVKLPSGYQWVDPENQDLGVKPIEGGPATQIPAELAARVGLTDEWLANFDTLRADIEKGSVSGPIDNLNAQWNSSSASADIYRRAQSGADALQRMLTGAGMNLTEAQQYASRYLPGPTDNTASALKKIDNLKRELETIREKAMRGRGGVERPAASAPGGTPPTNDDPLGIR
jgi:hypothetical protein